MNIDFKFTLLKTLSKIIYWFGITYVAIIIFVLTIGRYLPFEISQNTSGLFHVTIFLTFPLAVLMTLSPHNGQPQKKTVRNIKVAIALISIPFLALQPFSKTMCAYSDNDVVLISRSDTSFQIVKRNYDCGAWDSDSPNYEYFKIKKLTKLLTFSKKVDTATLKKSEWLMIEPE
jgi:hypothetical protein